MKEILCGFGVDVDAVAGWLGSYGGEDSPLDISRGMFSGEVGTTRVLDSSRASAISPKANRAATAGIGKIVGRDNTRPSVLVYS